MAMASTKGNERMISSWLQRRGIAFVGGFDIVLEQFAHDRQAASEFVHDRRGLAGRAFRDRPVRTLLRTSSCSRRIDAVEPLRGEVGERAIEDGVVVVQAGKKSLEQVFTDLADGALRGRVVRVAVVEAAKFFVGREQFGEVPVGKLVHRSA